MVEGERRGGKAGGGRSKNQFCSPAHAQATLAERVEILD